MGILGNLGKQLVGSLTGGDVLSAAGGLISGAANAIGQRNANSQSMALAQQNMALQKEFAQNGIKWKVEDAKAAGIHPLAALGVSPASFNPVSASFMPQSSALGGLGDMMSGLGQNINSTIQRTQTRQEKLMDLAVRMRAIDAGLGTQESEIRKNDAMATYYLSMAAGARQSGGPQFPSVAPDGTLLPGQGDSPSGVQLDPVKQPASIPGKPHMQAGGPPGWDVTANGPTDALGFVTRYRVGFANPDKVESDPYEYLSRFGERFARLGYTPDFYAPRKARPGYHWEGNPLTNELIEKPDPMWWRDPDGNVLAREHGSPERSAQYRAADRRLGKHIVNRFRQGYDWLRSGSSWKGFRW